MVKNFETIKLPIWLISIIVVLGGRPTVKQEHTGKLKVGTMTGTEALGSYDKISWSSKSGNLNHMQIGFVPKA